ncbi:MAG: transcriptional regulator [Pseudomonadota bacterium]
MNYQIGRWIFDSSLGRLSEGDTVVSLEPQASAVLLHMARCAPGVVSKAELMSAVWLDRVVEDSAVPRNIARLRRALGDDSKSPIYIETLSKRGYRVIAPVAEIPACVGTNQRHLSPESQCERWLGRHLKFPLSTAALVIATLGFGSGYYVGFLSNLKSTETQHFVVRPDA